jgi:hypothetical protein
VLCAALASCAGRAVYVHDTKTEADLKVDSAQCEQEAKRAVAQTVGAYVDQSAYRICMGGKGWRRVKR